MPLTLKNLKDLEDVGSNFDGAPDLESGHASKALGLEQSGLVFGAPSRGESPREDVEGKRDWWAD